MMTVRLPVLATILANNYAHLLRWAEGKSRLPPPPTFIWGPPGCAKSAVVHQVGKKYNAKVTDRRLAIMDPVDIHGIPSAVQGRTSWLPPDFIPTKGRNLLFLDEWAQAFPSVQNAASQLIYDRRIDDTELSRESYVVAASNRITDKAATHELPNHIKNRFQHYEVDVRFEDWRDWAASAGVDFRVIAFLNYRTNLMFTQPKNGENAFATLRTWDSLANIIDGVEKNEDILSSACATVGADAGTEFATFCKNTANIPTWDEIVANPTKCKLPTDPAPLYAVAALIGQRVDNKTTEKVWPFVEKLPDEYAVLSLYMIRARKEAEQIFAVKSISDFVTKRKYLFLSQGK